MTDKPKTAEEWQTLWENEPETFGCDLEVLIRFVQQDVIDHAKWDEYEKAAKLCDERLRDYHKSITTGRVGSDKTPATKGTDDAET